METLTIDFNQLRKPTWSDQEMANVHLVIDFVQNLMNDHNFDYVLEKFNNAIYKQHSRGIPDGLPALVTYVKGLTKRFPEYTYDVKHVYADGEFVIFHSHATMNKKHRGNDRKGFNIIDTWHIKDGKIAEHWDVIQPLDAFMRMFVWATGGAVKNDNGLF